MSKPTHTQRRIGFKSALSLSVGLTALTAFALPAIAQEAPEEEPEARTLQTITITATKREQTLQDVPVAVSVVDEDVIAKAEILDLADLQSVVPSLQVNQLQSSANTNFIIRGFGNGANNAGIEPSVGVFVDGVYRSRSAAQIADLPNLQRVEVLRGPQSTLFGKNASAGVISIVTRKASQELGGSIEGTVSNFNGYRAKGYLTGPITDTLAFSVGGSYNVRDGYVDDIAQNSQTNERNRYGLRGELLWEPSATAELRLIGDYDVIDEVCCAATNLINGPTGAIIGALGGQIVTDDPFNQQVANNFDSTNEVENGGLSLQGDFDIGFATLTSITAYRTSSLEQNADSDFTSADLVQRNFNQTDIETFTQEVRLTSSGEGMFDWMIGGFYFDETVEIDNEFFYGEDFRGYADFLTAGLGAPNALAGIEQAIGAPVGLTFQQPGQGLTEQFGQDNTAFSIFGTLDAHLTDRFTVTLGLNYTDDEKDAFGTIVSTDVFSGVDLVALGFAQALGGFGVDATDPAAVGAFAGANPAAFAAIQAASADPAQNPLLGLQAFQFLPPFLNYPNAVENGNTADDELTYTVRLAYDLDDNLNLYGSYATGFKASSWNLSRDSRPFASDFIGGSAVTGPAGSPIRDAGLAVPNLISGTRFAGPEEAAVWELGLKGAYDNFAFNLAYFDQTIRGFQSNVFTGTGFALANAGKQSVTGLEADITVNLGDNLTVGFAGTFLDPIYDSFEDAAEGDLSGTQPSGIPDTSTSTFATYTYDFANGWEGFVRADWQYESDTPFFDGGASSVNNALFNNAYTRENDVWNASAGFTTDNGLGVTVWGRNLFDHERVTTAFPSVAQAGSISGYPNQPATYGVTVRKLF